MSEQGVDIIVIGAGIAGVTAARDLSVKGYSVALVEARDRVGGRLYTAKGLDGNLELGGGYVHWTQPYVWRELQRHGLDHLTPPLEPETVFWLADGEVHKGSFETWYGSAGEHIQKCFGDARLHFPQPYDDAFLETATELDKQSIAERIASLGISAYGQDCIEGALGGLICSPEKHGIAQLLMGAAICFGEYGSYLETAGQWALSGGSKPLLDAMLAESPVQLHLNTAVVSVTDLGSHVTVKTRAGQQFTAKAALVAVPLNTMSSIAVQPPLPPRIQKMIEMRNPTMSAKVWARVKGHVEPFLALTPPGKHPLNAVRVEKRRGEDTLILCMCADAAMIPEDPQARSKVVQDGLRVFVPEITVLDTAMHDWVGDDFSQGAWMVHRPGQLTGAAREIRKPHGSIYFAGGDIAAVNPGSIEGAMESAVDATRAIAKQLGVSK